MPKCILLILLFLVALVGNAQNFSYSDNHISDAASVNIIGQVKDNIIVWYKESENFKRSVILVYDNRLNLIKKVKTDILHSDIDPVAGFYNGGDSFFVAYQYEKGNKWEYKLAGFDDHGKLSSNYIIDSATNLNTEDSSSYSFYQSVDNKTLECVKTVFNKQYNAIRFAFTFLNGGNLYRDSLSLGFDTAHEKLVDLLVDDYKNTTLLKTSNTDSGFSISVIKKEFSTGNLSIATKKIVAGNLRYGTSHIFNKLNNYTVYGVWEAALGNSLTSNQKNKTGLYTWKINDQLADMPGDTILHDDSATISAFNLYANNSLTNKPDNFFGIQTDSIHIPGPPAIRKSGQMVYQNIATGVGFFSYIEDNSPPEQTFSHYKAGFTVVNLSNDNRVVWRNELKNDRDSILLTDLSNNKIVAGKKGLHIVRSTTEKKKINTIEHILITYAGRYEKVNAMVWNNKYAYLVSNAVETNDGALIIPCVKGGRLIFARMVLE